MNILQRFHNRMKRKGVIWVEVMDAEGRMGWIPEAYLHRVTATPSPQIE